MNTKSFASGPGLAFTALILSFSFNGYCTTFNVPTTPYPHIQDAIIAAAASGDEIRVSNTYNEIESANDVIGKSITIRSYSPDFSTPSPGARWDSLAAAGVDDYLLSIADGGVTIEGFSVLQGQDCNVFFLNSNSSLSIKDCVVSGTVRADTAGIKATDVANVAIDIEGTTFSNNGRGLWLNRIGGNTSLRIKHSAFINNSSYPLNWESVAGNHVVEISDTYGETRGTSAASNPRMFRFFGFRAPAGTLTTNHLTFDRCYFYADAFGGRYPLSIAGVDDSADPNSTMTVTVRNSVFDLRDGLDNLETVAVNSQDDTATRRSELTMDHCTVVFGGVNQCGIRMRETQSTSTISNCIFEADGAGKVAFRTLRGKTISHMNLLNAAGISETFAGGSVELSGEEIVGQSSQMIDIPARNFQLASASPALGVGDDLGVTVDIMGNARPNPVGSDPDLGAYERGTTSNVRDWAIY